MHPDEESNHTMNKKAVLSQAAFEAFTEHEIEMLEKAIPLASYSEADGDDFRHSPVVICETEKDCSYWRAQISEWYRYAELLHLSAPKHFPKNAKLFNPAPLMITSVASCILSTVPAVSSQPIKKDKILKMLNNQLKAVMRNPRLVDMGADVEIRRSIEEFSSREEEKYRVRRSGYTCLRATLAMEDGTQRLQVVPHRGLFLFSSSDTPVKFKRSRENSRNRVSAYDRITPIPCPTGLVGEIYSQSDVDRAMAEVKAEFKKSRD